MRTSYSRKFCLLVHRWTGLVLALYAVVIGITGSLLVFHDELLTVVRPQFHAGPMVRIQTTPDDVLAVTRRALPGWNALSVTWPYEHSPHFHVFCIKDGASRIAYVNARDGNLVGVIDPRSDLVGITDALHGNLMLARTGRLLNGYGGILIMVLCLTGIVIWWPSRSNWRSWLRLRGRHSWWRVPWDLHHAAGFAALPFLFVIALTGTYFTWGQFYQRTISSMFQRFVEPKLPAEAIQKNPSLADLAAAAQRALPGPRILRLEVVPKANRPVSVTMSEGETGEFHLVSTVYLDPRDGEVLKVKRLILRPFGDTLLGYISAVHFGVFGGLPIRLLWFLSGLALAALALTGVLLWWRGLRRFN